MSELNNSPMFFLGANSPKGFVSHFGDNFSHEDSWRTFIIKGGPGTGKSTVMKRVALHFLKQNIRVSLFPCSSDPTSLDAVIFPDFKVIMLDGTSPHLLDPKYPGVCEEIINLGDCWNESILLNNKDAVINLTNQNRTLHTRARNYLSSASALMEDTRIIAKEYTDEEKAKKFALKLSKKHIPKTKTKGIEWQRFLSSVTPKGPYFFRKTIEKLAEKVVVITDEYGAVSPIILEEIRKTALNFGHEIITCYCPFFPTSKCEHIFIPSLSLAFCTSNKFHPIKTEERGIHARRFMNTSALHTHKARLNYNRKAISELLSIATDTLSEAKAVHDKLESHYIKAMNFEKLNAYSEAILRKILSTIKI